MLCEGRALFRFKKCGIRAKGKTVVIQSKFYDRMKYKTFDNAAERK